MERSISILCYINEMHSFFSNKKLRDAQVKVRYHFLLIAEPGNLCALILFKFTTTSKRFSVFQNTLQINNIILGNTYLDSLQNSLLHNTHTTDRVPQQQSEVGIRQYHRAMRWSYNSVTYTHVKRYRIGTLSIFT